MTEILVPTARVVDIVICEEQVPFSMRPDVSGLVRGMAQAREIAQAMGRAHKPTKPLMVYGPDDRTPILIMGEGVTEAAEMEDLALEAIGRQEERVKAHGRGFDFDSAREKVGAMRREDIPAAMADAFARRAAYLRANRRTAAGR